MHPIALEGRSRRSRLTADHRLLGLLLVADLPPASLEYGKPFPFTSASSRTLFNGYVSSRVTRGWTRLTVEFPLCADCPAVGAAE
jgi:hypothetical protein